MTRQQAEVIVEQLRAEGATNIDVYEMPYYPGDFGVHYNRAQGGGGCYFTIHIDAPAFSLPLVELN